MQDFLHQQYEVAFLKDPHPILKPNYQLPKHFVSLFRPIQKQEVPSVFLSFQRNLAGCMVPRSYHFTYLCARPIQPYHPREHSHVHDHAPAAPLPPMVWWLSSKTLNQDQTITPVSCGLWSGSCWVTLRLQRVCTFFCRGFPVAHSLGLVVYVRFMDGIQ